MKHLPTLLLLALLVLGGCSQEPKYDGLWLIDKEQTKAKCIETLAGNTVNDPPEKKDNSFSEELAESFGSTISEMACEGAVLIFPVLEIEENKFTLKMLGSTAICNVKQESNTLDCVSEGESMMDLDLSVTDNPIRLEEDILVWSYLDNATKLFTVDLIYKRK